MSYSQNRMDCQDYKLKIKGQAFDIMGRFSDLRALQIDHKDQSEFEQGHSLRGGTNLYRAIVQGKVDVTKLQVLCANCNWIKRSENGEHSHSKPKIQKDCISKLFNI